jgi:cardiolipin synthase A/B
VTWKFVFSAVEIAWIVGASCWILLEKRSPTATLAWIFCLAVLPIVGSLVYIYLGPRRIERKRIVRLTRIADVTRDAVPYLTVAPSPERQHIGQLMLLATHRDGIPPSTARTVELYTTGAATFGAIIAAIGAARHHVHLEYYIYEPDTTGTRVRDALIERARAGVEVRLLVDSIGSLHARGAFVAPLIAAGAKVGYFNTALGAALPGRHLINFRTHRKIVVVDGTVGFCGGINIHDDENLEVKGDKAWRDTHLRIEGDAVRGLQLIFLEDWAFSTRESVASKAYFPDSEGGEHYVQVVASGPDGDAFAIAKVYFACIATARERVWLTSPYFVPDDALLAALVTAAARGVDVHLLVSKRSDSRLVDAAGRSYFDELLRSGVKIHQYGPPMVHAKTLVVDDDVAIVGTANFDNRSLRLNFEVVVMLYGEALATQLGDIFRGDLARSLPVSLLDAKRLPGRLFEAAARLLSPQL